MSDKNDNISAPLLTWPAGWGKERPRGVFLFAVILFGIGALVSIPYTIEAAKAENGLRALYGIGIGLVSLTFILIAIPHLRVRRKALPPHLSVGAATTDRTKLRFPYLTYWKRILFLWLSVGAAFLVVRGALFLRDSSDQERGIARAILDIGGLATVAVALIVTVALLAYLFLGRERKPGSISLDATGISQELGHTRRVISWDDIGSISACIVNNAHTVRIAPKAGMRISVDTGKSVIDRWQSGLLERSIDVPVWVLGMDPVLLLYTVRYYWQNPDARDELASDAVIDRMQRGDLAVQP